MALMGANGAAVNGEGAMSGVIEMGDRVEYTHRNTILESVGCARHKEAEHLAFHYFCTEWDASINQPIELIKMLISS